MKILQLIHKIQNRGAETFTCQLSNHLISLGHEVRLVALYNGSATLPLHTEIIILNEITRNRFFDYLGWKRLSNLISEYQPDIIQVNAGDTLKYAVFSKKLFGWKTPVISRNASEVGRYLKSPLQKRLNSFFYKNVDFVISVSLASEKDILNHFPFLEGKTKVIPVGLEPILKIGETSFKPEKRHHIVHVGGFTFEKNHFGLLKIFQSVLKSMPNVHLHLVGDGPLKAETEELVKKMNLIPHITFYGFVNNPLSYISAADILVLPSIIEGLPGVLLEAMMSKTPVVAYNVGGISEIITAETGNLIEKNNESNFIKAILESLENPNRNQIENAYQMVVKDYMNEKIALRFVEVYKRIAPQPPKGE